MARTHGGSLAVLAATACMFLMVSVLVTRELRINLFDYIKNLAPSLILSLVLLGLPSLLMALATDIHLQSWLPFGSLMVGGFVYIACVLYLDRDTLYQLRRSFALQS